MAKKYTAKHIQDVLRFVLLGAFEHLEALKGEIKKIGPVSEDTDPQILHRAKMLHLAMTSINDIIHPAHHMCETILGKENKPYFDNLRKSFALLVEKKMVSSCFCVGCDPDKSKAKEFEAKYQAAKREKDLEKIGEA